MELLIEFCSYREFPFRDTAVFIPLIAKMLDENTIGFASYVLGY